LLSLRTGDRKIRTPVQIPSMVPSSFQGETGLMTNSSPVTSGTVEPCSGCGLILAGGTEACERMFQALVGRGFSDASYAQVHRLMVDTYCLQHPDRYCASAKSLAAHLTGLCWILEHDGSRAVGEQNLRKWLDGPSPVERPAIPSARGHLTIADVFPSKDLAAYLQAVERWARATWDAYASLHPLAREWIRRTIERGDMPSAPGRARRRRSK
jgi:hypothetical protein